MNADEQNRLVEALCDPARYPHPVDGVQRRETHISHVLLAGEYAYKIKKPLDLGFLDFSTLDRRRHYCHEEIRLNGRLASIYLEAIAITGTPANPSLGGSGEPIEWAVRMLRFDERQLLDRRLSAGTLERPTIDELADRVAAFHAGAPATASDDEYGTPEAVARPMRENFAQIAPLVTDEDRARLERLSRWTEERLSACRPALIRRRAEGRIRECHGDMHVGNMVALDDGVAIFDGIEFNAGLRWIDVASEIAFVVMDLDCRGAPGLAGRFLDRWLAASGDYDALAVMHPYLVYRAMVRAKTAAIRLSQGAAADAARELTTIFDDHLVLAERYAAAHAPAIAIAHGVAGTGKSTAAAALVERLGAIRIRADIERRRLFPDPRPGIRYSAEAHDAVYARLEALAARATRAGFPVIVDATFLEHERRAVFERLATRRGIPFRILDMRVPPATVEHRIDQRQRTGDDPSEASREVMAGQRRRLEPLAGSEVAAAIPVDNSGAVPAIPATGLAHARGFDGPA